MNSDGVPLRCPACRRDHVYVPPAYPCACGTPLAPPIQRGATPSPITHRTWTDTWVTVRCRACGRQSQWPQPELGCSCGAVLRVPVRPVTAPTGAKAAGHRQPRAGDRPPGGGDRPTEAPARAAFRPLTIRTARDAVTAAGLYLTWLGFGDVLHAEPPPASGIDLRGRDLVAQVDPTTRPASLKAVECLWLHAMTTSARSVHFSLAGYAPDARRRADELGVPLFVLDLTGTPQPVNGAARKLVSAGA
ncbi:hypothetical protein [Streptomyces xanthochromogenes]|uniref:Restriction endonuclease type IV Mrr domain-containing protein n=1 Tax=Streptomyces xanthochromogenes TaxID=67384 RepID=A0ABQ3A8A3_9ACTN|nr:hypothetical protein [Streptomyces xanthochromogenes]GGY38966.1 hypothetical protein GCM10010326_36300 [Streptomyces xanthochromogenes]